MLVIYFHVHTFTRPSEVVFHGRDIRGLQFSGHSIYSFPDAQDVTSHHLRSIMLTHPPSQQLGHDKV